MAWLDNIRRERKKNLQHLKWLQMIHQDYTPCFDYCFDISVLCVADIPFGFLLDSIKFYVFIL